jgi:hypothetical protein
MITFVNKKQDIYTDNWLNAYEMNKRNPETFHIPNLTALVPGCLIRISNGDERFYVHVLYMSKSYIIGQVNNFLIYDKGYNYGDFIKFKRENVLQVHSKNYYKKLCKNATYINDYINTGLNVMPISNHINTVR